MNAVLIQPDVVNHRCRPADQGGLDDQAELLDLPANFPSAPGAAGHPYFVVVTPEAAAAANAMYTPVQVSGARWCSLWEFLSSSGGVPACMLQLE